MNLVYSAVLLAIARGFLVKDEYDDDDDDDAW